MQEEEDSDVQIICMLLLEFYNSATSNDRRKVIEAELTVWRAKETTWLTCTHILYKPNIAEFVTMFCLNTFEEIVKTKWLTMEWTQSREIKHTLLQYSKKPDLPQVVLNKTVYLVVYINKLDWPRINDGIFHHVYDMLQSNTWHIINVGILYAQTLSEVVTSPCSEISVVLYQEQQRAFTEHIRFMIRKIFELMINKKASEIIALRAFSHIFTWVPIDMIPAPLLVELFQMAIDQSDNDKALLALTNINEVLVRHCASPWWEWPEFSKFVGSLLANPPPNKMFLDRICDFLTLVFTACLSRSIIANNFMSIAIEWTKRQTTLYPGLTSVMHVWSTVLEHPTAKEYGEKLVFLVNILLRKILWSYNKSLPIEEDGEDIFNEVDEDECPWQRVTRPCFEVIARIGELFPEQVVGLVVAEWIRLTVQANVDDGQGPETEHKLRDLAALTRTIGRLSPVWGETDNGNFTAALHHQLLSILRLEYNSPPEHIQNCLDSTICEALAAVKAYSHWLNRLSIEELHISSKEVFSKISNILLKSTSKKMQHCAAHTFTTYTAALRLSDMWRLEELQPLFQLNYIHLEKEDAYLVTGGLINVLILPAQMDENGQRMELANAFVARITRPLFDGPEAHLNQIETLRLLEYIVRLYESEGSKQKKLLCSLLENSASRCLELYSNCQNNGLLTREILLFYQILLECLQTQVGITFVQAVAHTFLSLFTRESLELALTTEHGNGLHQILAILELVIRTPALAAAGLTPLTITVCLQLSEIIFKNEDALTVHEAYFCLVYSILEHKWQYLVKGSMDSDQRMGEFLGLLKIISKSLQLRDINLFRINLAHLEKLNTRWRLYRTNIFKKELFYDIMSTLLSILMNRSQSLVAEDIALCLCHMVIADPEGFFAAYLPRFMTSYDLVEYQQQQLLTNFSRDLDLPSLTKNINRFVNDITVNLPV